LDYLYFYIHTFVVDVFGVLYDIFLYFLAMITYEIGKSDCIFV